MISKNKLMMISLGLVGAMNAAFSTGCNIPIDAGSPTTVMNMQANVFDYNGNALDYPFDYYLDMYLYDGTHLIYHTDQQHTDSNGVWSSSQANMQFFIDNGGVKCYDSCVSYDNYGCTEYATDCYNSNYTATLDTNTIASSAATIGIDTGTQYIAYPSSQNLSSFQAGAHSFTQNDVFDTNIQVIYSGNNGPGLQSFGTVSSKTIQVNGAVKDSRQVRAHRPKIIKDLSKLTPKQKSLLNQTRKALNLPTLE